LLPGNFIRVSKSSILNSAKVRAIHKNITGASEVEFVGSNKKVFVSRNYFKVLMAKLEEKRLMKYEK
jgi:DNA-binding LytR/AlgR family response regulator